MGLIFSPAGANFGAKVIPSAFYPHIINGDGAYAGAPARIEDAAWPMDNIFTQDRYFPFRMPAGSGNFNGGSDYAIEIDLGGTKTVFGVGIGGFVHGPFPNSGYVERKQSTPYSAGGFLSAGSLGSSLTPDTVSLFGTSFLCRYLRIVLGFAQFASTPTDIGKVYILTSAPADLGFLYAGASYSIVTPQTRVEGYGAQPVVTYTGAAYRRARLDFRNVDATTLASIQAIATAQKPFLLWDPIGTSPSEYLPDESFDFDHIWAPPNRFTFSLSARQLP